MAATSLALQRQPSTASSRFSSRNYPPEVGPTMSKEEAALISSRIDDEIKKEASRLKDAKKREVKVMLLGQAESGKSTLQKQFQLFYASKTLDAERQSWIPVVYSNIIKALRMIFAELDHELTLRTANEPLSSPEVTQELNGLRVRLLPLLAQEDVLATELSGGVSIAGGRTGAYVRQGWQSIITGSKSSETKRAELANRTRETTRLVGRTLALAVDDIDALWTHEAVKFYIQQRKIRLDDSASYFLKHIQRIGDADYVPSNDDILHVRLQTLGVQEHRFPIPMAGKTYDWKLYDVGGARGQRHRWIPYFDDATAIIFLAPISAFDQFLEEDPKTNRIDDSLTLFSNICSNELLKDAHLVVLLNKIDLLRAKLDAGAKVRKYITSFGDRANNFETVSDYFRSHFIQVHRRKGFQSRQLHVHFTSMLDIKATQSIISNVAEAIMRKHIAEVGLA